MGDENVRVLVPSLLFAVSLLCAAPAPAATVALTGATVIDGTGRPPIKDAVVVITDGMITAVGPRKTVSAPPAAKRIDLTGKTIVPGLINAHGHVEFDPKAATAPRRQLNDQLDLYARYGVTTVYSLGDDGVESVRLRDDIRKSGPGVGARLYVAGPILNPKDVASGREAVTANVARGVDIIKIRLQGPPDAAIRQPEVLQAITKEAHADKRMVAAHIFTAAEAQLVLDAGVNVLAHSIRDRDIEPAMIAEIKRNGVGYIPTLTRDLSVFVYESTPAFVSDPFFAKEQAYKAPLAALLTPEAQARVRDSTSSQAIKPALAQARRNLKTLSDAGVPIAMGTDTGAPSGRWQGYFEHVELEMMVEAGLTPMQALVAATGGAAKVMHIDDAVGTLQPGRHADLLVLSASPLADIRNTRRLEQVWIAGRRLD
jgi:imidazolonepropionase-like amidohydrolase